MKALFSGVILMASLTATAAIAQAPDEVPGSNAVDAAAPAPAPVEAGPATPPTDAAAAAATDSTATSAEASPAPSASPAPRAVRVYEPEYRKRLDIGGTFGFNAAGGFGPFSGYGLMADVRLFPMFSLGGTVGWGLWGPRLTPHARIYPAGIARGFFFEGGLTLNAGGDVAWCREAEDRSAFGSCEDSDKVKLDLEAVRTVNATLGYRHDIAGRGWIAAQVGWAYRLDDPDFTVERGTLNEDEADVVKFARPGGLLIGIAGGFSVL